jgi:DNA-binding NtrC family response regulator
MNVKRKPSILIVDDNISQTRTMNFILRRTGYDVDTAVNGPEAIEMVKDKPFEMIFMDIKMPLMNGVETYKKVKKIRPNAIVVMMTAYAVEDLVQEALEEGAAGIIYKPMDIDKVIDLIKESREIKKGAFILVVDDDPGTCVSLKNILTKKSFTVGIAHSGEEAINIVREKVYDVIFIDMKLPVMNGLETYLAIKEINPEAVAIMITAYHQEMEDLVETAINNDAYTCLYKPLDMAEVLKLIEGILERKR